MEGKGKRARKVFNMASQHHMQISGLVTSAEVSDGCGGELAGCLYLSVDGKSL